MRGHYFDAGECRSCTLMGTDYSTQLAALEAGVRRLLDEVGSTGDIAWEPIVAGPESGFRNKAKLAVGGRRGQVTIGILDADRRGVDLRHCGLYEPQLAAVLPALAEVIDAIGLRPYDVPSRRGELKQLLLTCSARDELMLRCVLRTRHEVPLLRKHLAAIERALPGLRVVTVNLQPEHKAVLEGAEEFALTDRTALAMPVGDVVTWLPPRSFFQTNTRVAGELYRTAARWAADVEPRQALDLYCGVGGFALHLAGLGCSVTGVESSAEAVAGAHRAAAEAGLEARFVIGDATTAGLAPPGGQSADRQADLVVVNPPRRGLGPELCAELESTGPETVLYSSCNATTLARDLAALGSYRPVRGRVFAMFPQTEHAETLLMLRRG